MIKNLTKLELSANDRVYTLLCESDSPTCDLKEVLLEMIKRIQKVEDDAKESLEKSQEVEEIHGEELYS